MEEQGKEKQKKKRKVSFFTVFLWLLLIVVMAVIMINGIVTQNAVEDSDVLRIRVKVEGLETEEIKEAYQNLKIQAVESYSDSHPNIYATFQFVEQNSEGYYIYEASKEAVSSVRYDYDIQFEKVHIEGYAQDMESDTFFEVNQNFWAESYIDKNETVDYTIKINYVPEAKIKIRLNIEGIDSNWFKREILDRAVFFLTLDGKRFEYKVSYVEEGIGVALIDEISPNKENVFLHASIDTKNYYDLPREYEISGKKTFIYGYEINGYRIELGKIPAGEELEVNITAYYMEYDTTNASKSVKWVDKDTGKAQIELGYTSIATLTYKPNNINICGKDIIYQDTLSDEFELSAEYQNSDKWSILETTSEEQENGIPKDVLNEFYKVDEETPTGKEYVYVKDTNTIYWLEDEIKFKNGSTYINVIYKNYEEINLEVNLESNKESSLNYVSYREYYDYMMREKYNISSPMLKFSHTEEAIIKVNKLVQGEKGSNTYYIGIFEDETSNKTDQIYEIVTQDGEGNITIEIEDKNKTYYVYDVDENGNKIVDEEIEYSKNKIEFGGYIRESKIETDSQVVSSVISGFYDETKEITTEEDGWECYYFESPVEETKGSGEEKYIDNVLNVKDIYQEEIIISSKAMKLHVTYIPEEGGSLEGEKEEIVDPGNTPEKVPTPKAEEGYQFVRWEVEENGERIEVNPNEYVIMKDTVFYAIFEKVPVDVDTSDIQVWVYVGVALVAIAVIVLVVVILRKNKSNK